MKITEAINQLFETYRKAEKWEYINKPVSWSLYQVWKWADSKEKNRNEKRRK